MGITTKISQQLEGNSLLRPNHTKQFARQKPPPPQGPRTNQEMSANVREFPGSESPTRHHWSTISRHGQALNTTCLEDRNTKTHGNSTRHHLPQGDASQNTDHVLHMLIRQDRSLTFLWPAPYVCIYVFYAFLLHTYSYIPKKLKHLFSMQRNIQLFRANLKYQLPIP